ncbi:hypothetical protein PPL_01064 [Heterostelium album PN500]|uniref:AraC effector-binding domain-containing protein n=1 Tax=Heterostelium pallidum (strain ATCC 26659 / Pp 5 / PN500) TaxID=670386 RepID=D3AY06_HETP5|nr:hypothetical protein PPL_01064 [Heterostelium album PN500]EFA85833.1 hypothetical protein PPL_01064 [Heterostelium album PN500]|eukprot:XP_020437939.1 hypothetical protein PPL_01064 [Heterostelium album PN500]
MQSLPEFKVDIVTLEQIDAIAFFTNGAYFSETAAASFGRLGKFTKENVFKYNKWVGVYYDDPAKKPAAELRSAAAVTVSKEVLESLRSKMEEAGGQQITWEAGEYAVVHYIGPYTGLSAAYDFIYTQWLPQNKRTAVPDYHAYEHYLNDCTDTAPADLLTDIFIKLQ